MIRPVMSSPTAAERLQKVLAGLGLGSRRAVEDWIREGRVQVNGARAELGQRVAAGDRVTVDGREVDLGAAPGPAGAAGAEGAAGAAGATPASRAVLGYHKPIGEVTTRSDPQGRPTVFDRLPPPPAGRWIVVGRLDFNTSGLLLFTNDGDLAHRLMHPSSEVPREYLARVAGRPSGATLARLLRGVELDDGPARFDRLEPAVTGVTGPGMAASGDTTEYRVTLHEGRNREVRRMWSAVGHDVLRLARLRFGPVSLPEDLRPGQGRLLPPALVAALARTAGVSVSYQGPASDPTSGPSAL
jgi:23S rRNA pseudouridine2605 synthase